MQYNDKYNKTESEENKTGVEENKKEEIAIDIHKSNHKRNKKSEMKRNINKEVTKKINLENIDPNIINETINQIDQELNDKTNIQNNNEKNNNEKNNDTENKIDNYSEWSALIDRSNSLHHIHSKSTTLWLYINYAFNISSIIISSIVTADGIGNIFDNSILIILGIVLVILSSVNAFIQPSSKYTKHHDTSKKFRTIYHQTRRCSNFTAFVELQKQFEEIEQNAPDIPACFNRKKVKVLFMNPKLQQEFNEFYQYKNNPVSVVNIFASKND